MSLPSPSEIASALIAREEMPPEKGDIGPQGMDGKAGEFGPPGPQGAKGDPGRNGTNGSNGNVGPKGPQGNGGPRGPKGEKGDKGDEGERGPIGPMGPTGAVGSGKALFPRPGGGSGGGAPSGAAGGDLSGTYPNPSVVNDSHSHTGATLPVVTAREWIQGSDGALASGTNLPWAHFAGDALLDYTNPLVPTVIEAGVYAVMTTVQGPAGIADITKKMFVGLDVIGGDVFQDGIADLVPVNLGSPVANRSLTVYFAASDTLELIIYHNLAAPDAFGHTAWVQRIT